jgi:hypothetical protein
MFEWRHAGDRMQPALTPGDGEATDGHRALTLGREPAGRRYPHRAHLVREATHAVLGRLHAVNPKLNAITVVLADAALAVPGGGGGGGAENGSSVNWAFISPSMLSRWERTGGPGWIGSCLGARQSESSDRATCPVLTVRREPDTRRE